MTKPPVHPPGVLGNGQRLFADGTSPTALELIGTTTTSRGIVLHVYQPSGRPDYVSVALEQEGGVVRRAPSEVDHGLPDEMIGGRIAHLASKGVERVLAVGGAAGRPASAYTFDQA